MATNNGTTKAGAKKAPKTLTPNQPTAVKPFTYKGPGNAVIKLTPTGMAKNPKHHNTAAYGLYAAYGKGNITVDNYLKAVNAAKLPRANAARYAIGWDIAYGYITVS